MVENKVELDRLKREYEIFKEDYHCKELEVEKNRKNKKEYEENLNRIS